jgi:hypothetical protein
MGALKQQRPTERPARQAGIAAHLIHLDLNDLRDHVAERACGIWRASQIPDLPYQFTCPA